MNWSLSIETRWCVITGAPSSGKTTIINEIARRSSLLTNPDITRQYIESEILNGNNKFSIRADYERFLQITLERKVLNAKSLPTDQLIIHDYGIPDHVAYARYMNVPVTLEMIEASTMFRYAKVLIFDPLPLEEDLVRDETIEAQYRLDKLIESTYLDLQYQVVRIPVLLIDERYQIVMEIINNYF